MVERIRLSEAEAAERIGCSIGHIRSLRNRRLIGYYKIAGKVWYTPEQCDAYEESQRHDPCPPQTTQESSATSKDTGSNKSRAATLASGTGHGTTAPADKSAVIQLARETFRRPTKRLSNGSSTTSDRETPSAAP